CPHNSGSRQRRLLGCHGQTFAAEASCAGSSAPGARQPVEGSREGRGQRMIDPFFICQLADALLHEIAHGTRPLGSTIRTPADEAADTVVDLTALSDEGTSDSE